MSFRILPRGAVFSNKGPAIFCDNDEGDEILFVCGLLCSAVFGALLATQLGRVSLAQSYEVGLVQATPFPLIAPDVAKQLAKLAQRAWCEKWKLDSATSTSHAFVFPALLKTSGSTLVERASAWAARVRASDESIAAIQAEIDDIAFRVYGLDAADRAALTSTLATESTADAAAEADDDEEAEAASADARALTADLLAYALGAAFGRWDVRLATGQRLAPPEPDPFDPLPVCAPGMLQDTAGHSATPADVSAEYPLRISWPGIFVDDPNHPDDLECRVREVLAVLFPDCAEAVEQEACGILGVNSLREYFRKPGGFFADHLKRYWESLSVIRTLESQR